MLSRLLAATMVIFALAGFVATQVSADDTVHGKIESAGSGKISIKDGCGTVQSFSVDSGAKITLDGKKVKLDELTTGASVAVTTEKKKDETVAVMITAESPL